MWRLMEVFLKEQNRHHRVVNKMGHCSGSKRLDGPGPVADITGIS